jgi:hypothetical protein
MLTDVFLSIILPRGVSATFRPSGRFTRLLWPLWRRRALAIADEFKREDFLATFAPLNLCLLLAMWIAGLILGYGIVVFGLRDGLRPLPGFFDALYFAGTSLLTIGYGDIAPLSLPARFVSLMAGASGFGVVAVCTTFLFQTFGAFQTREVFVTRLASRAGAPASGVHLLETYALLGITNELDALLREAEVWCAQLLDSHIAYPILCYFRSSHDFQSWLGTLGALVDASTLAVTVIAERPHGHAKLLNQLGRHAVHDLADYFGFEETSGTGIERAEFDIACARLRDAGYTLRDADAAWARFAAVRATYAGSLNAMARWWNIPPSLWIGDRSFLKSGPHATHTPPPLAHADETAAPAEHSAVPIEL